MLITSVKSSLLKEGISENHFKLQRRLTCLGCLKCSWKYQIYTDDLAIKGHPSDMFYGHELQYLRFDAQSKKKSIKYWVSKNRKETPPK